MNADTALKHVLKVQAYRQAIKRYEEELGTRRITPKNGKVLESYFAVIDNLKEMLYEEAAQIGKQD